jgi:hypothetical protein
LWGFFFGVGDAKLMGRISFHLKVQSHLIFLSIYLLIYILHIFLIINVTNVCNKIKINKLTKFITLYGCGAILVKDLIYFIDTSGSSFYDCTLQENVGYAR